MNFARQGVFFLSFFPIDGVISASRYSPEVRNNLIAQIFRRSGKCEVYRRTYMLGCARTYVKSLEVTLCSRSLEWLICDA